MKIFNRLLISLITCFLFIVAVGAEEPINNDEQQTTTFNAENVAEETIKILEDGTITTVEENNNKTSEDIENSETADEEENTIVEAPIQSTNPSIEDETSVISENGELAEVQQQPELGNFTYELIYNEDHTIATVIMEYSGECSELTLNNEDIITEVVNIGVYRVNMEYGDWANTMAFDILVNGMFSFKINVWNGDELLETEEVSGSITGLNNDALLFEPNQEPITYEITSSDVGSSDSRNMTLSYETNVSFTWSIPTELPMADIEDDLTVTVNNSNLATETALRIRVASNNNYNLVNSESGQSLSYMMKDLSDNLIHNNDVILDHIYNQDTTSNSLHFKLTQMPVMSGKYEDTLCFTASVERMLKDLYSGQIVTVSNLGTTHNLINTKIYGISKQDGTPTPDNPIEIQSVVNPTVTVSGRNLLNPTLETQTVNGVTCTNNGDGTYTVNGTASADSVFWLFNKVDYVDMSEFNNLKLVGSPNGSSVSTYALGFSGSDADNIYDYGNGATLSLVDGALYRPQILVKSGQTVNNVIFKPMITADLNATYDDFEPYTTDESQTATLPYTLNAIPVKSGGNITVNGQQYIADYVDIENKKLHRYVGEFDLGSLNYRLRPDGSFENEIAKNLPIGYTKTYYAICTRYKLSDWQRVTLNTEDNIFTIWKYETWPYITLAIRNNSYTDATEFKNAMSGVKMLYELATPTITDLTDAEVQAFKDLYTYMPTTVVSASSEQLTPYIEFGLS